MKASHGVPALALSILFSALPAIAHAWEVEDDAYAPEEGVSSEYQSFEASDDPDGAEALPADMPGGHDEEGAGSASDVDVIAPPPPPLDDGEEEDLYPQRRRAPAYDDAAEEDDDDGWTPLGAQRSGEGERRGHGAEDEEEEEDGGSATASSFFGKKNIGLTAELALGGLFRQGSLGALEPKFGLGLSVAWNLGRMIFDPDLRFLHRGLWIELAWLHPFGAGGEEGTEMTRVTQSQNNLSLSVMLGYPLWRLLLYGKLGPALYIGGLNYDVDGSKGHWSVVRGGLVYGVGVHSMFFFNDAIGLSGRVELIGHRRHYYNDLQLSVSLGAAF